MSILTKDIETIWKDATTSNTWWHQVAGYAAIIVAGIDPGSSLSGQVQLALISFGAVIVGLDLFGKHQTTKAKVQAAATTAATSAAAATTSTTIVRTETAPK